MAFCDVIRPVRAYGHGIDRANTACATTATGALGCILVDPIASIGWPQRDRRWGMALLRSVRALPERARA